jgi:predicted Rossmann fold nucleotide-binding protein DprA/Smf involved in DNA uptake
VAVAGLGAAGLLEGLLTAFFASRQCPGTAIRAAIDWASQQARGRGAVIGGFHSPLEQSVQRLLMESGSAIVVVLARPVAGASLNSAWHAALDAGKMAVVSRSVSTQRLTEQAADDRNELAARLADQIVVAHASPGGRLRQQYARWLADQLDIRRLSDTDAPP